MFKAGVIEPIKVKEQVLKSAFEATAMILRIDEVIAATRRKEEKPSKSESSSEL